MEYITAETAAPNFLTTARHDNMELRYLEGYRVNRAIRVRLTSGLEIYTSKLPCPPASVR